MPIDKDKHTQVLVTFPNDMLKMIEKHWHRQELQNRNEAIRDLVKKGLDSQK